MIHTDGVATVSAREDLRTEVRTPGGVALSKVYRVRAEIDTMLDELRPGDRVPAERELAGRFGVARETVRHALRDLAVEGRIRRQGRGTVLARPKVVRPLAPESAGEEAAGVVRRLLSWEDGVADAEVARDLDLAPQTPIMTLERLLFADGDPIALERIDLSLDRFGWLRAAFDPLSSLATTIGDSGVEYAGTTERIETVLAAPREAALLRCRPAVPLFRVVRRGIDTQGRPIERVAALYRGDRVAFEVRTAGRRRCGGARAVGGQGRERPRRPAGQRLLLLNHARAYPSAAAPRNPHPDTRGSPHHRTPGVRVEGNRPRRLRTVGADPRDHREDAYRRQDRGPGPGRGR